VGMHHQRGNWVEWMFGEGFIYAQTRVLGIFYLRTLEKVVAS
jgi:hypothetical protein